MKKKKTLPKDTIEPIAAKNANDADNFNENNTESKEPKSSTNKQFSRLEKG